jgi:hypothetical protein
MKTNSNYNEKHFPEEKDALPFELRDVKHRMR